MSEIPNNRCTINSRVSRYCGKKNYSLFCIVHFIPFSWEQNIRKNYSIFRIVCFIPFLWEQNILIYFCEVFSFQYLSGQWFLNYVVSVRLKISQTWKYDFTQTRTEFLKTHDLLNLSCHVSQRLDYTSGIENSVIPLVY